MTLVIDRYDGDSATWDGCVRTGTGWTHYHLFAWKPLLERVFRHDCPYLVARDASGAVRGVLPLVRVKSRLFGHYLVSMPFLNYGGPLGSPDAVRALTAHAVAMARAEDVKLLEFRSPVPLDIDLDVSHRKITVLLDLPARAEDLWNLLPTKMRTKVRKPQKEGVELRFGPDQVEPFWRVFAHHMRDLGTPVLPARFFAALRDAFGDSVWFACAYHRGEPIACGCGFAWDREFELTWSSALTAHRDLRANFLLHWSFMERAVERGITRFNFGRSTPGSGTHEFKRQWGSRDADLWWYQFARGGAHATPSPTDPAYAWGPRIWKRIPLSIANRVGPHIVRCIP